MEQSKNSSNNATLKIGDFLKLFAKKFKLMVCIGVIAGIIGGAVGYFLDSLNVKYTAEMNISISPSDETDVLLFELRSGMFAEKLLLEANGLPPKDKCNENDYNAAVAALEAYEKARVDRQEKYYELSYYYMAPIENEYNNLSNDYDRAYNLLKLYKDTPLEGLDRDERENHLKMIEIYEEKLIAAEAAKREYEEAVYLPAKEKKVQLQTELSQTKDEMESRKREADAAVEKVLSVWRTDDDVKDAVIKIGECVTYDYFGVTKPQEEGETKDEVEYLNKGFIRILISVPKDEQFANDLVEKFRLHITDYVEKHLEFVTGQVEVDCMLTSPIVSVERNPSSWIISAAKTAIAFGAVAAAATYLLCAVRMLLKATDKREDETTD